MSDGFSEHGILGGFGKKFAFLDRGSRPPENPVYEAAIKVKNFRGSLEDKQRLLFELRNDLFKKAWRNERGASDSEIFLDIMDLSREAENFANKYKQSRDEADRLAAAITSSIVRAMEMKLMKDISQKSSRDSS